MSGRRDSGRPKWPSWFRPKRYLHFDAPLRSPWCVQSLVEDPQRVARHGFLPFVRFKKTSFRFNREENRYKPKSRPLAYAGHLDSQIFRRYAILLSERYESLLDQLGIAESVLAYRRFVPAKCNIHFANDAFRFIETSAPCAALAFDVTQFFESLNHGLLKTYWKQMLGVRALPEDHYAVFRAITRYAWVEQSDVIRALGISKSQWRKRRGRLCSPADFRELIRSSEAEHGIIQSKDDGKGIPQGSPISAILSNIYMLDLDTRLARVAKEHNGAYWRYSDDILIACPIEAKSGMEAQLRSSIAQVKLELNDQKTARPEFRHAQNSGISASQPLQYLGFTFDGEKVRVRPQTVVRYMRRMRRAVRQEKMLARRQSEHGGDGTIRRKRLYSRFTHLGKRNFISYARKAKDVFPVNGIRDQIKHHWRDLHAELVVE